AQKIGCRRSPPERVRLRVVDEIPLPENPALRRIQRKKYRGDLPRESDCQRNLVGLEWSARMRNRCYVKRTLSAIAGMTVVMSSNAALPSDYKGKPFQDAFY